jgi:hypothetical protein
LSPEEFEDFREQAHNSPVQINELCKQEFKIGALQHWAYELENGTLTFSSDGVPRVIAAIQAAGSTPNKSGTWMWGWANPWPDAWCTICHQPFKEDGEWNGQNEWRMKIKLLCHRCYESARAKGTFSK